MERPSGDMRGCQTRRPPGAAAVTAIRIEVLGVPVPQGSTRSFAIKKGGAYTGRTATTSDNPKLRAWRDLVAKAASDVMLDRDMDNFHNLHEGIGRECGPN